MDIQPFSQKSRTPTVVKEFEIGLYDPQRPTWNSFAKVGVRDFWENGCTPQGYIHDNPWCAHDAYAQEDAEGGAKTMWCTIDGEGGGAGDGGAASKGGFR